MLLSDRHSQNVSASIEDRELSAITTEERLEYEKQRSPIDWRVDGRLTVTMPELMNAFWPIASSAVCERSMLTRFGVLLNAYWPISVIEGGRVTVSSKGQDAKQDSGI